MNYGYAGKTVLINLSDRSVNIEPVNLKEEKEYLGGFGSTYKMAYDIVKPGTDALAPDNPIVFGSGTLVGTTVPGAVKITAVTKLPLTGTFGWSHGSMNFAAMLKYAGYDHMVITGKADRPVYVRITDEQVEIHDAGRLWGRDIPEATGQIKKGQEEASVLCIGQAGENQVNFSLALIDNISTLGQGGLAAVMGSKNLKAVSVYGTQGIRVSDKRRFSRAINGLKKRYMNFKARDIVLEMGMMAGWDSLVTSYFSNEVMEPEEITKCFGLEQFKKIKLKNIGCIGCLVADKEVIEIRGGKFGHQLIPITSYQEIPAFASAFGIRDISEGAYIFDLCNRYGISTQTLEGYLSFIIELSKNGFLKKGDLEGLECEYNFETVKALIEMIVHRKGIGDILADGWEAVINKFGEGCKKYAYTNKNSNIIWDPRIGTLGTMEFEQLVSPKGPYSAFGGSPTTVPNLEPDFLKRHCKRVGANEDRINRIFNDPLGLNVGRMTVCFEDWVTILSSMGICNRASNDRYYSATLIAELFSAATGIEMTESQIVEAAKRVWTITRAINAREGFSKKDDVIPDQWFSTLKTVDGKEHIMRDYFKKKVLERDDLEQWLEDYYIERGWDPQNGTPEIEPH